MAPLGFFLEAPCKPACFQLVTRRFRKLSQVKQGIPHLRSEHETLGPYGQCNCRHYIQMLEMTVNFSESPF